jgi:hypothetical protein
VLKNIVIPGYIRDGIGHNWKGFPKRYKLWGADFETVRGEPYTFQVCDGKEAILEWIEPDTVLDEFIKYFEPRVLKGHVNIVYFHNLKFDIGVLFFKFHQRFINRQSFTLKYKGHRFYVVYSAVKFVRCYFKDDRELFIYDSIAFTQGGSLDKWCKVLNLPVKKMERPADIGERKFKDEYSIEYAKTDAWAEYWLADWIIKQHKDYDLRICVSSAQFSARVFRHNFMTKRMNIPFPSIPISRACVRSYHGGRNGFYLDSPSILENCSEIDISSSYPYAMTQLPNFASGKYRKVKELQKDFEGVYLVSGVYRGCRYPSIFTEDFKEMEKGSVFKVWTTSYELREAIKDRSIENLKIKTGYVFVDNPGRKNPFKDFVKYFYEKKESSRDKPDRYHFYKIILNALYGKFIQTSLHEDDEEDLETETKENLLGVFIESVEGEVLDLVKKNNNDYFVAGGLFNPFIATLITGYARAYLHRLEHKYNAVHSSTDSVKFNHKYFDKEKPGLGGYKIEVTGKCICLRNKVYVHYDRSGNIKKYALHGFQGHLPELLELIKTRKTTYSTKRILGIREAYRQKEKPLMMLDLTGRELDVDFTRLKTVRNY